MPLFHYSLNPGGILSSWQCRNRGDSHGPVQPPWLPRRAFFDDWIPLGEQTWLISLPHSLGPGWMRSRLQPLRRGKHFRHQVSNPSPTSCSCNVILQPQYWSRMRAIYCTSAEKPENTSNRRRARPIGIYSPCLARVLGSALSEAFHKAVRQKVVVELKDVKIGANGGTQIVDVTVQPVTSPEALCGMVMVVFTDIAKASTAKGSDSPPV